MCSALAERTYPSYSSSLSIEDQQRMAVILDEYLIATEEGRQPSRVELLAANPDLAPFLSEYLDGLQLLRKMASPIAEIPGSRFAPARSLADYDLECELGRGSMGVVYAATQRSLGKRVAIKVLSFGGALDGNRLKRFQREAHATAALIHPGIVSVFDVGCDEGTHFYVMQLVNGQSLDRHIELARKRTESPIGAGDVALLLCGPDRHLAAARLIGEAAEAMHFAHLAGIVHRDIKPSNLLVDADGHLRLTDFGLARFDSHADLTRSGELIGTLRYMSPEQASGKVELVDGRTDIYSLGATLYELVTLQPAFRDDDGPTLLRSICENRPSPPRAIDDSIPRDLQAIIEKSMHPERPARYQSAQELALDLQRFLDGKPVRAKRRGPAEKLADWSRKNTGLLLGILAVVSLVATGSLLHTILLTAEQNRTKQATALYRETYERARQAVDSLGNDVARRLASIPQADSVRRDILAEALSYYEKFIDSTLDDPSLRSDVARTKLQVARIVRQTGTFEDAAKAYRIAIESLSAIQGSSQALATEFVGAINESAMMHSEHGDQQKALRLLFNIDLSRASAASQALTLNNRSVVRLKSGEIALSRSEIAKAIELIKPITHRPVNTVTDGAEIATLENLAVSLSNLSALLGQAGELDQARKLADSAIEIRRASRSGPSTDFGRLERLAIAHGNLGALTWKAGDGAAALNSFQESVELFERATRAAPNRVLIRRELAVALNNLAMVATSLNEHQRADSALDRACKIAEAEFQSDPKNAESASHLAGIQNNRAVLLRKLHRHSEADQLLANSLKHQSIAVELAPNTKSYRQSLDQIRFTLSGKTK